MSGLRSTSPRRGLAERPCPFCGETAPVAFRARSYVSNLAECPCGGVFENRPVPRLEPTGIEYLDRYIAAGGRDDRFETHRLRHRLVGEYAWAVPTEAALAALAELGPLVEIGAGGGYWAKELRARRVDIDAYDERPGSNHWVHRDWGGVATGGPDELRSIEGRALFLCWPPMDEMARDCLAAFSGDTVAYIGEHSGGCCASDDFFSELDRAWTPILDVQIPHWPGIHDYLSIWRKDNAKTKR